MSDASRLQELGIDRDEVLAGLSLTEEPYCVFLSGSVIEGYGNTESDLDVYVVYAGNLPAVRADFVRSTNTIAMEYTNNWGLDIESWTQEHVQAAANRLHECSPDDWNACIGVRLRDVLLAHALRIGAPILHSEHFALLQQSFDYSQLSRVLMVRALLSYDSAAEDVAGAIASRQHGTALLTARQALQHAVDARLYAAGETNIKEKWRFYKLEKLGDASLLERYWALETPMVHVRDDILTYARDCLLFAQQLTLAAQSGLAR